MEKLHIHRKTHNTKRTWIIGTEVQSSHETFVGGSESLRLVAASFLVKFKSTKKEEQSRCWHGWAKGCGYHQDKIIMNKDKVQAPSANILKKNSLVECQVDRSPNLKIVECIYAITYCNIGLFKLGTERYSISESFLTWCGLTTEGCMNLLSLPTLNSSIITTTAVTKSTSKWATLLLISFFLSTQLCTLRIRLVYHAIMPH